MAFASKDKMSQRYLLSKYAESMQGEVSFAYLDTPELDATEYFCKQAFFQNNKKATLYPINMPDASVGEDKVLAFMRKHLESIPEPVTYDEEESDRPTRPQPTQRSSRSRPNADTSPEPKKSSHKKNLANIRQAHIDAETIEQRVFPIEGDIISELAKHRNKFDIIWLDWCGTHKKHGSFNDFVTTAFAFKENRKPNIGSVLAVTLSTHAITDTLDGAVKMSGFKIMRYMNFLLNKNTGIGFNIKTSAVYPGKPRPVGTKWVIIDGEEGVSHCTKYVNDALLEALERKKKYTDQTTLSFDEQELNSLNTNNLSEDGDYFVQSNGKDYSFKLKHDDTATRMIFMVGTTTAERFKIPQDPELAVEYGKHIGKRMLIPIEGPEYRADPDSLAYGKYLKINNHIVARTYNGNPGGATRDRSGKLMAKYYLQFKTLCSDWSQDQKNVQRSFSVEEVKNYSELYNDFVSRRKSEKQKDILSVMCKAQIEGDATEKESLNRALAAVTVKPESKRKRPASSETSDTESEAERKYPRFKGTKQHRQLTSALLWPSFGETQSSSVGYL